MRAMIETKEYIPEHASTASSLLFCSVSDRESLAMRHDCILNLLLHSQRPDCILKYIELTGVRPWSQQ